MVPPELIRKAEPFALVDQILLAECFPLNRGYLFQRWLNFVWGIKLSEGSGDLEVWRTAPGSRSGHLRGKDNRGTWQLVSQAEIIDLAAGNHLTPIAYEALRLADYL